MAGGSSAYADDQSEAVIAEINVTPLVDIVLVLLIVFMITVPTLVTIDLMKERELKIALPRASEAKPLTFRPTEVIVNVEASGRYLVLGGELSLEELHAHLEQAAVDNPDRATVKIYADKQVPWQYVVNVMNLCNAVDIDNYSVAASE